MSVESELLVVLIFVTGGGFVCVLYAIEGIADRISKRLDR